MFVTHSRILIKAWGRTHNISFSFYLTNGPNKKVLQYTRLKSLASDKHSSLLRPFVIYEENKELQIWPQNVKIRVVFCVLGYAPALFSNVRLGHKSVWGDKQPSLSQPAPKNSLQNGPFWVFHFEEHNWLNWWSLKQATYYERHFKQGSLTEREGRLSTVDLLVQFRPAAFEKDKHYLLFTKLIRT